MVSSNMEDLKLCRCDRCPSYPDCAADKNILLFCIEGEAPCEVKRRGCICPSCPVHDKYHFTMTFYCADGTEEVRK